MVISVEDLFPFNNEFGYLGIIIFSFITSVVLFIPIPYFPVLVIAAFNNNFDPHLISLFSALGIAAGRTVIFFISYYGYKILSERTRKRVSPLQKLLSKYGWLAAFIAALTPFPPDDAIIISLGLAKYTPWKFVLASFTGKLIANEFLVWGAVILGRPFVERLIVESGNPINLILIAGATTVITVITIYLFLKMDWAKVIGRWFPWTLENNKSSQDEDSKDPKY